MIVNVASLEKLDIKAPLRDFTNIVPPISDEVGTHNPHKTRFELAKEESQREWNGTLESMDVIKKSYNPVPIKTSNEQTNQKQETATR